MTVTSHASMTTMGSRRAPAELFEPEPDAVIQSAAHRAADPGSTPAAGSTTPSHGSLCRTSSARPHVTTYQLLGLVIALLLAAVVLHVV